MRESVTRQEEPKKFLGISAPKSLFGRTALILFFPLLLAVAISTFVFFDRTWDSTTRQFAQDLAGQVSSLCSLHTQSNFTDAALTAHAQDHYNFQIEVLDQAFYKQAPRSRRGLAFRIFSDALAEKIDAPTKLYMGRREIQVHIHTSPHVLRITFPSKWLINQANTVFVIWQLCTPILFFFIALIMLRGQLKPLQRLCAEMERFGKGQKVAPLHLTGAQELRQAALAFNRMQARLARLVNRRTEMLAGISHDLRTPLTRLELGLALMEKTTDVSGLRLDVKEMSKMVESFLAFARDQEGEKTQNVPIHALLAEVLLPIHATTHVECDGELSIPARRLALKRCLANILNNADQFANHIWVSVTLEPNSVIILVDDNGPGIPADKRMDAFRPFVRLDASRNLDKGGVGLGLAIARDIVSQHGGKILLQDGPHGGLRVRMLLPT